MKLPNIPILELAVSMTFIIVPLVTQKLVEKKQEKTRLIKENVYVLKPSQYGQ